MDQKRPVKGLLVLQAGAFPSLPQSMSSSSNSAAARAPLDSGSPVTHIVASWGLWFIYGGFYKLRDPLWGLVIRALKFEVIVRALDFWRLPYSCRDLGTATQYIGNWASTVRSEISEMAVASGMGPRLRPA